ncbi:envelope integrity protein Cei [Pseudonocardia sp. TRM90224]|uniref:envelope integrity protein Cei n=1 Tax=Pseudonocardia sp. TRM90224 TaxID=2812678 RepID=UPI001E49721C|nr:envelope integrity protein Cei [Pseudonocardia sp. TRM90224]
MTTVRNRPYQRRRKGPIIVTVSVLAAIALATWTTVLVSGSSAAGAAACPAAAQGPGPGEVLAGDALNGTQPVAPSSVRVRVSNGGGQRGQALLVAAQLAELGFGEYAEAINDPFYPDGEMECVAQLRFGASGSAGASTLSLLLPCAELVRDGRGDDTVDVAIGTAFGDLNPSRPVRQVLEQLAAPAAGNDGAGNADPQGGDPAAQPAAVDPAALEKAREGRC